MKQRFLSKCKRCEHEWLSRKEKPTVCPACHSPYWHSERKKKP